MGRSTIQNPRNRWMMTCRSGVPVWPGQRATTGWLRSSVDGRRRVRGVLHPEGDSAIADTLERTTRAGQTLEGMVEATMRTTAFLLEPAVSGPVSSGRMMTKTPETTGNRCTRPATERPTTQSLRGSRSSILRMPQGDPYRDASGWQTHPGLSRGSRPQGGQCPCHDVIRFSDFCYIFSTNLLK